MLAKWKHKLSVSLVKRAGRILPDNWISKARGGNVPALEGICIVGHVLSEIGLGEAARCLAHACKARNIPLSLCNIETKGRERENEFQELCIDRPDRRVNVYVVGLASVKKLPDKFIPGARNVLYPFWELERIPVRWHRAIKAFDEVWAPSEFIAHAFEQLGTPPVRLLRQPVRLPDACAPPRGGSSTRFLTFFDYDSFGVRKNPLATIRAFKDAFARDECVELIIKTRGDQDAGLRKVLADHALEDARIRVLDTYLDRPAMSRLLSDADVFVSLHRSEGFGFGAAEAIAAGKPVVATNYGGTTDFINDETGFPVAYDLVPVGPKEYVDTERQVWAAARHESSVATLVQVYSDPSSARGRVERGFALLRKNHSFDAVGTRLAELMDSPTEFIGRTK